MLKNEYLGAQNIYICDNSNLSFKGKPIDRFLSTKDGFHLSNQGITMFAANIRDTIDEVLNLPKRNTSPRPQTRRPSQSYYNNYNHYYARRGYYRGRGRGRGNW